MTVVKSEFEKVSSELLEMRALIKKESFEANSGFTNRMLAFEDFKGKVLKTLEEWEEKTC